MKKDIIQVSEQTKMKGGGPFICPGKTAHELTET